MNIEDYLVKSEVYLSMLCVDLPSRRLGSAGNQTAVKNAAEVISKFGFKVEFQKFECVDWENLSAKLKVKNQHFVVYTSPYSLGCDIKAKMVTASTINELENIEAKGKVLLLLGELTSEQLMPNKFSFYNPEHHQKIYSLLESKQPAAIITATGRNPELAGGMYPFPMIEDGDFDIPSVFMKDTDGEILKNFSNQTISLEINSKRISSEGANVVALKSGKSNKKIVFCAHIDSKDDTPGALDNGTGVVTLFLLAEMLKDYSGNYGIEIVLLNGEDHYSAQGQKEYLLRYGGRFEKIYFAVNIDVAGYKDGTTAFSFYGCPKELEFTARQEFGKFSDMKEGKQWYQSDHSIFIQNQTPAIAFTSSEFIHLSKNITHTQMDNPELVDHMKILNLAAALKNLVSALDLVD